MLTPRLESNSGSTVQKTGLTKTQTLPPSPSTTRSLGSTRAPRLDSNWIRRSGGDGNPPIISCTPSRSSGSGSGGVIGRQLLLQALLIRARASRVAGAINTRDVGRCFRGRPHSRQSGFGHHLHRHGLSSRPTDIYIYLSSPKKNNLSPYRFAARNSDHRLTDRQTDRQTDPTRLRRGTKIQRLLR